MGGLPKRFWIEVILGLASAALLAFTLWMPDWLEQLFGLAADAGDGSTEWGLALTLAVVTLALFAMAGRTVRRARSIALGPATADHRY